MTNENWLTDIKLLLGAETFKKCQKDIQRLYMYQKIIENTQTADPNSKDIPQLGIPFEGYGDAHSHKRWYIQGISTHFAPKTGALEVLAINSDIKKVCFSGDKIHFEYYGSCKNPQLLAFYDPCGDVRFSRGLKEGKYVSGYAVIKSHGREDDEYKEIPASPDDLTMNDVREILIGLFHRMKTVEEKLDIET